MNDIDTSKVLLPGEVNITDEEFKLTKNVPLIVSNVLCLLVMAVELVRNKKKK